MMKKKGYTYRKILKFLRDESDISVCLSTLYWFVTESLERERKAKRRRQSPPTAPAFVAPRPTPVRRALVGALDPAIEALKKKAPVATRKGGNWTYDESVGIEVLPKDREEGAL